MISTDNIIFTVINYASYGIVLYWAGKRFIIPYLARERADERAYMTTWYRRGDQLQKVRDHLGAQHTFFTLVFNKFFDYHRRLAAAFAQARHSKLEHDQRALDLLNKQYKKIYEEHQRVCTYQQRMPEVIKRAESQLQEYYRDPAHVAEYFEHMRVHMARRKI